MLVLRRAANEQIVIGDNIVITVTEIGGKWVAIGVDAPATMPIHRREVYDRILTHQHFGALDPFDGGPPGSPDVAPTERVGPDLSVLGITPRPVDQAEKLRERLRRNAK